jgi:hypothetical protein
MRLTRIITAKIQPEIYTRIVRENKQFEVRTESFHHADYIRYVGSNAGVLFGVYELGPEIRIDRDEPNVNEFVKSLSGISDTEFDELFPYRKLFNDMTTGPRYLYVAKIGRRICDLNTIFDEEKEPVPNDVQPMSSVGMVRQMRDED